MGIHKGIKENRNWNVGIFIKNPIETFYQYFSEKNNNINTIVNNKEDEELKKEKKIKIKKCKEK